jgi:hypothetical protein
MKSVAKLKKIIKDEMEIVNFKDGSSLFIRRYPNNIIQINGKSISWINLKTLIKNGPYGIWYQGDVVDLFDVVNLDRGGKRAGAGRKKINPELKAKVISISLDPEVLNKLDHLCVKSMTKRSSFLATIITQKYNEIYKKKGA